MKKLLVGCICVLLLLSGCSSGAPSNKDLKEVIYGTYLREASIIRKELCEDAAVSEGSALWLVHFLYEGDDQPNGYLIEKKPDGSLVPFRMPSRNAVCPK